MDKETMTESKDSPSDALRKTEPMESAVPSLDFIPLQRPIKHEDNSQDSASKQNTTGNGNERNGQKRIKNESDNGSSKKPRLDTPEAISISSGNRGNSDDNMSDVEEYYLTVSNLPSDWTYVQIKNYLDSECGHVDEMEMLNMKNSPDYAIRLTFQNVQDCKNAYIKLENKVIQDKKVVVEMSEASGQNEGTVGTPESVCSGSIEDAQGLYGLRQQFLTSLNIKPPINRMVHVTNFRCDKNELKEVMELAGNVLMCCVVATANRYAKVMYSHPLEAVQAISMLNGQMYYGSPLKITMDSNHNDAIVLPKGLGGVGLGLGLQGKPIRDIAQQYKRYIQNQNSIVNPILFSKLNDNDSVCVQFEEDPDEIQKKITEFINSTPQRNILNPTVSLRVKNIDELESQDSKDGSDRGTPEMGAKVSQSGGRKSSIGSLSPSLDPSRNGAEKINNNNSIKPLMSLAPISPLVTHINPPFARPALLNPPASIRTFGPVPTPGHPNYRPMQNQPKPSFAHQQNQPRPNQYEPRLNQFRPRPMPYIPRPPFGPQTLPGPFVPSSGGIRPAHQPQGPVPGPVNLSSRPYLGPMPAGPRPNLSGPRPNPAAPGPNLNPGVRVTVSFSNLPPSTTFPLLCEQLAKCGQVMSVQLTTPGCAVATFGHPSHADRCLQTFNGMNVEGYIIEAKFT